MGEKVFDIEGKYEDEIMRIRNILNGLESGYIQELTRASYHGALATNVGDLKKELNELFNKIQYGKAPDSDKKGELF